MSLNYLPGHSRIWIFQTDKYLEKEELIILKENLDGFINGWQAHGKDLAAGYQIVENCAVVVGVDEEAEMPSGCSIDKVFRLLTNKGEQFSCTFFNRTSLIVRIEENLRIFTVPEIEEALINNQINENTPVLNSLATDINTWNSAAEIPFAQSWLGKKLISAGKSG